MANGGQLLRHELMLSYLPFNLSDVPVLEINLSTPPTDTPRHSADPAAQVQAWRQWALSTIRP